MSKQAKEKRVAKVPFIIGCILGLLGVDRFMRGQAGFAILKIFTMGGIFVWVIIDLVIAITKMGQYDKEFIFVKGKWKDMSGSAPVSQGQAVSGSGWTCSCGQGGNNGNFCNSCGGGKPAADWNCSCGQTGITGSFCPGCGNKRP